MCLISNFALTFSWFLIYILLLFVSISLLLLPTPSILNFESLGFNSPLIEWNLGLPTSSVLAARLVADPSARSISVCSASSTLFNLCFFYSEFLIFFSIQFCFQVRILRQMKRLQLSSWVLWLYSNSQFVLLYFSETQFAWIGQSYFSSF